MADIGANESLVSVPLALVGQVLVLFGVDVPLCVFLSNLLFEVGAGFWLVLRDRPARSAAATS